MEAQKLWMLDKERRPVPIDNLFIWARWAAKVGYPVRVGLTETDHHAVSTVFLGVNHRFFDDGPPLLFETMVWRDGEIAGQQRYASWDDAEAGHNAMVRRVQSHEEEQT